MVYVTWDDAVAYANWSGKRLPTEAEWEYAARGGLIGKRYPWGDEFNNNDRNANYSDGDGPDATGGNDTWIRCAPVGSFEANGYGLHDMAGNVWEWCADWYDRDYYSVSPAKNPLGPGTGQIRVIRDGAWDFGGGVEELLVGRQSSLSCRLAVTTPKERLNPWGRPAQHGLFNGCHGLSNQSRK